MIKDFIALIRNKGQSLLREEAGVVAIVFALLANILLGVLALAIDGGRGMMTETAIASATDAAALAGAIGGGSHNDVEKYFIANLRAGKYGISYNYQSNVHVQITNGAVQVRPTGFQIPTAFAGTLNTQGQAGTGWKNLSIGGSSSVSLQNQQIVPADFAFVLDFSGSMMGSNITALKAAVNHGLDLIGANNQQNPNQLSYVTIDGYNTDLAYPPQPLSTDIVQLKTQLAGMQASGMTCGSCGLQPIVPMLPDMQNQVKAVIFMTDGQFNTVINSNNPGGDSGAGAQVLQYCNMLKQDPAVSLWTVGYGYGANGSASVLEQCASTPDQYIHANDPQELWNAFNTFVSTMGNIVITQ